MSRSWTQWMRQGETMKTKLIIASVLLIGLSGCANETITPREQAQIDKELNPTILNKELVTRFHRIGENTLICTSFRCAEFLGDTTDIFSPEDYRNAVHDNVLFGDGSEAKQPIYLVREDSGDGPYLVVQQADPEIKTINGSLYISEDTITEAQ